MSLIQRKPRPLKRDRDGFRDDRLFIVACDDTYAPRQYFESFQWPRVKVHVVPADGGRCAAAHVLDRLVAFDHEPDDELWMLLDTDHYTEPSHVGAFLNALQDATKRSVKIALSKPCFEVWLLLHHEDEAGVVPLENAGAVDAALRARLGQFNKTRLRHEHFPREAADLACERAERLDSSVSGRLIPAGNTTRVYKLWKAIREQSRGPGGGAS